MIIEFASLSPQEGKGKEKKKDKRKEQKERGKSREEERGKKRTGNGLLISLRDSRRQQGGSKQTAGTDT